MHDLLYRVSIHTIPVLADLLEEALPAAGHAISVWTDAASTLARVDRFAVNRDEAEHAAEELRTLVESLSQGEPWSLTIDELPREDWAESWKRFFHAERVSDRVIVRPSWESFPTGPGDQEVVMDAGMAFGTGQHGTTRACIRFLDTIAAAGHAGSLLDAGCGSGILAIAAVKLGFSPVTAIDLDSLAVEQTRNNARSNGVGNAIRLETADVLTYAPAAPFDTVAANIEAPILLAAADTFAQRLCARRRGASLLLAGILERQYPEVRDAFLRRGFVEKTGIVLDEWSSGWFERP